MSSFVFPRGMYFIEFSFLSVFLASQCWWNYG